MVVVLPQDAASIVSLQSVPGTRHSFRLQREKFSRVFCGGNFIKKMLEKYFSRNLKGFRGGVTIKMLWE